MLLFDLRDAEEGQPHRSKKELIDLAKEIAAASKEVSAYSAKIAKNCPDKRVSQVGIGGGVGGDERSSHVSNREGMGVGSFKLSFLVKADSVRLIVGGGGNGCGGEGRGWSIRLVMAVERLEIVG